MIWVWNDDDVQHTLQPPPTLTWYHRRLAIPPKTILLDSPKISSLFLLKPNPGVMASGKDVVLPCAAAVCWTHASENTEDHDLCFYSTHIWILWCDLEPSQNFKMKGSSEDSQNILQNSRLICSAEQSTHMSASDAKVVLS
ncbi:hypothetical protein L484_017734 [Morus notabilis]|uniref:Uncharacterized protein n=1 Tax=Morus notabilis TaxID=981085 RepID=W9SC27_9ROSA|nr:hypothetical protein L484_017734 [Morus notabilis]